MATATKTKHPAPAVLRAAMRISAVADEHRLGLLLTLEGGPRRPAEMSDQGPAASHRLSILRHAGMVEARSGGMSRKYALTEEGRTLLAGLGPLLREEAGDGDQ